MEEKNPEKKITHETFASIPIDYSAYPTLKIQNGDGLRYFSDILTDISKQHKTGGIPSTLTGNINGINVNNLEIYFDKKIGELQQFIDEINRKILKHKTDYNESQTSIQGESKSKTVAEEHQGAIISEKNKILLRRFKTIMKTQPNCNSSKNNAIGIEIKSKAFSSSSELNIKIYSYLEKCFDFLISLLVEYCKIVGWGELSISKELLFKKEEKVQQPQSPQQQQQQQQPQSPQQSHQQPRPGFSPSNAFPGLGMGGGLNSKKKNNTTNNKKQLNKKTKKKIRGLKNNISRKSNSRYMRVSKK